MKALNSNAVLYVTDVERALNYYTTVLGFAEDFKLEDYAGLALNNVCIHLSGPGNMGIKKLPGNTLFCIECDEVDDYFNTISAKGAIIKGPPADRFYGLRDFAVNDPDGNTLSFGKVIIDTP